LTFFVDQKDSALLFEQRLVFRDRHEAGRVFTVGIRANTAGADEQMVFLICDRHGEDQSVDAQEEILGRSRRVEVRVWGKLTLQL